MSGRAEGLRFSANLGFLWTNLALPEAIRAAAAAGFDAVECHQPYDQPASEVARALRDTGMPMMSLNTIHGAPGANGLTALPRRQAEARAAIDMALDYADRIGATNVHVMAGIAEGPEAHATYCANLAYATDAARAAGRTILIEPLNQGDAPGYFLRTCDQAAAIIAEVGADNLKLMFDCYHVQITEGDVAARLERHLPIIGHIQIASAPERGPPDHGDLDYGNIFGALTRLGWTTPIGAEYHPGGATENSLGWLRAAAGRAG